MEHTANIDLVITCNEISNFMDCNVKHGVNDWCEYIRVYRGRSEQSIIRFYRQLKDINSDCIPTLLPPFHCSGFYLLLGLRPKGTPMEEYVQNVDNRKSILQESTIPGNMSITPEFTALVRCLTENIQMFHSCNIRPNFVPSSCFVDDNKIVFTSFVEKETPLRCPQPEWSITCHTVLSCFETLFAEASPSRVYFSQWFKTFNHLLVNPTLNMREKLLSDHVFFGKLQRIGYIILLWDEILCVETCSAIQSPHFSGSFLQPYGLLFLDWDTKANNEPKLVNIQRLNIRREEEKRKVTIPDLWPRQKPYRAGFQNHDRIVNFVGYVRNALAHFKANEVLMKTMPDNVPYTDAGDLLDTMDRVWKGHFSGILRIGRTVFNMS